METHLIVFVEKCLLPQLWKGAVVVMDNVPAHKVKEIEPLIQFPGRNCSLSVTSRLLTLILSNTLWSQLKAFLRSFSNSTNSVVTNLAFRVSKSLIIWFAGGCNSSSALVRAIHAAVSTKTFTKQNHPALVCRGDNNHIGELSHESLYLPDIP